jgi:hypothetical protein
MYDEREARQLCIRALNQFLKSSDILIHESADGEKTLGLLKDGKAPIQTNGGILCRALASYLKSLKSIENFMISDPAYRGFDGSNPLLMALNKEISLTLDTKAQLCHDELQKRQSRIDW